jgi:hypothetical protein
MQTEGAEGKKFSFLKKGVVDMFCNDIQYICELNN